MTSSVWIASMLKQHDDKADWQRAHMGDGVLHPAHTIIDGSASMCQHRLISTFDMLTSCLSAGRA